MPLLYDTPFHLLLLICLQPYAALYAEDASAFARDYAEVFTPDENGSIKINDDDDDIFNLI